MDRLGADVIGAVHVSMDLRAAARAGKTPPAWRVLVTVPALTARLGGRGFLNPLHLDAPSRRLLTQIPHELAMGPLADLLVGLRA
jgi:hypothetical protein